MGSGLYCSTIEEGEEKSCNDDRKEFIDSFIPRLCHFIPNF